MLASAIHFALLLLLIGAGIRLAEAKLVQRNPDSGLAKALTFAY